ncbi:MAG: hypothetical protein ACRECI_05565, partial [Methyloceanibacter sp.]
TRNGIAAAYVWIAPRVRALSAVTYRTTAKSLSFVGAKSDAFARASLRQTSRAVAWLGAKAEAASLTSLKATSSALASAGVKSREASVVAGQQVRRGAASLKRTTLATKDWVASSMSRSRRAEPSSELPPEPADSSELQVGAGDVAPQISEAPEIAPPTRARRSRANPRTIRASRRALRQNPRVAGRQPVRR